MLATAPKTSGSAQSRSTSAGSSSSTGHMEAFPDIHYPVPFIVKNTFLDEAWRPSSLDGFFQERVTRSCISRLEEYPTGLELTRPPLFVSKTSIVTEEPEFYDAVEDGFPGSPWATSPVPYPHSRPVETPLPIGSHCPPAAAASGGQAVASSTANSTACVLRLSEVLPEAGAGMRVAAVPDDIDFPLPTKGSAGHFDGTCKPCAFFHTKGCRQGPECEFCHLCESGERKRRRKEKVTLMRQQRALQNITNDMGYLMSAAPMASGLN